MCDHKGCLCGGKLNPIRSPKFQPTEDKHNDKIQEPTPATKYRSCYLEGVKWLLICKLGQDCDVEKNTIKNTFF